MVQSALADRALPLHTQKRMPGGSVATGDGGTSVPGLGDLCLGGLAAAVADLRSAAAARRTVRRRVDDRTMAGVVRPGPAKGAAARHRPDAAGGSRLDRAIGRLPGAPRRWAARREDSLAWLA